MTRLILHIGQHKTGTTALQRQLARRRFCLKRSGVIFPQLPGWKYAHHALYPFFFGLDQCDPYVFRHLGDSPSRVVSASREAWERVKSAVLNQDPKTVILSSETFFRAGNAAEMDRFAKILREVFDEVEVACYLRNPAELLLSILSTQIQVSPHFEWPPPSLRKDVLAAYDRVHADEYHIRKYDRDTLVKGDITCDFWRQVIDDDTPGPVSQSINKSLSAEAMILMKRYVESNDPSPDEHLPMRQQIFRRLLKQLDHHLKGYRSARPRPAAKAAALDACTDLEWLWQKHGIRWRKPAGYTQTNASEFLNGKELLIDELCDVDTDRLRRLERRASFLGMYRVLGSTR